MRTRIALGLLLLLASACSRRAPATTKQEGSKVDAAPAVEVESLDALRESARETLDANCAECHTRGLATALPRALKVYDITEPDWSRHMTDAQLREALRRLNEPFAPTRGEGDVRPIHVSDEARARFARFVELEIARRDDGGAR